MDDRAGTERDMQRHEVPTVFVHGWADPLDVQYVEDRLCAALLRSPAVRYSVLWIEATTAPLMVEIEAGVGDDIVNERRSGTTVRNAGETCIAAFVRRIAPVVATNGA
jgi:hypothetical protein